MRYRWLLTAVCCGCFCFQLRADTLHVYFPRDVAFLDKAIEKQLDTQIAVIKNEKNILVIGYADSDGDTYYNDMLSMRRAQNVAAYLSANGLSESNIKLVYGKGEIARSPAEKNLYKYDRRVDIVGYSVLPKKIPRPAPAPVKATAPPKAEETVSEKLDSVEVGGTLALNNIQFVPGEPTPLRSSNHDLFELYEAMKNNPGLKIQIEGHICCDNEPVGDTLLHGYRLSRMRAQVVYNYLKRRGISADRMDYKGFSSWRKLAAEDDDEGKAKNRRVEIRVMQK